MTLAERLGARVGEDLGVGEWMEITQDRVDRFADLTEDHQWIHQAGERAAAGPFGGPIAHGFLTLSLLTPLSGPVTRSLTEGSRMVINYGFDRVRFVSPVPVGSRIRARGRLAEVTPVEGGAQAKTELTIEVEGTDRPAVVAEHLIRVYE
ncbi:MAG: MaoC family dehydratase [Acidimicrobiia bacterium]